jgi:hypothetical protein
LVWILGFGFVFGLELGFGFGFGFGFDFTVLVLVCVLVLLIRIRIFFFLLGTVSHLGRLKGIPLQNFHKLRRSSKGDSAPEIDRDRGTRGDGSMNTLLL